MTESDLIYFISVTNSVEYHWINDGDDVIIFVDHYLIKELMDIIGDTYLTNHETECILRYGYIGLQMRNICEYFDIDMEKVFRNGK